MLLVCLGGVIRSGESWPFHIPNPILPTNMSVMLTMSEQQVHSFTVQCTIIKFLAHGGAEAMEIFQKLTVNIGNQILSRTHVFAWHTEFKEGENECKMRNRITVLVPSLQITNSISSRHF